MQIQWVFRFASVLASATLAVTAHSQAAMTAPQIGLSGGTQGNLQTSVANRATQGTGVTIVPEDFSKLKIAPGFLLDVQVLDEPDLSFQLRVDDNGNIIVPLVGTLPVAGDTQIEAQQSIEESLKAHQILKYPQVIVNLLQYAPAIVTVMGEVTAPGRLQMLAPHNLLDVMSFAGGETALAGGEILLRHGQPGQVETSAYHYGRDSNGDTISGVTVRNGDTVIVPRAGIVYVLGAVNRPGGYLMQENGKLDAAQAISLAMGLDIAAKTSVVRIVRRNPNGTFEEFSVSYKDFTEGKTVPPQLQAQDIVYVPMSHVKSAIIHGAGLAGQAAYVTVYGAK